MKAIYWKGFRDGLPFLLVIGPFGMLFGVVATEAGFSVFETISFSVLVIAGAAQFTAVQLMTENAPTIVVLLTALAVNLRMAMYSAALAPYLGAAPLWKRILVAYFNVDQTYAVSVLKFEKQNGWGVRERFAYFIGVVTPICPVWNAMTVVGAVAGGAIPPELALDFAIPITFLAIVAPGLRTLAHVAAAIASVVLALSLAWMPYSLGLIIAALIAMAVGAFVEQRMEARP